LGFGVWGLGFEDWGLGFGVLGFGFWVSGFGFRVWSFGFRVSGFWFSIEGIGFRGHGAPPCVQRGLTVWGLGLECMVDDFSFRFHGLKLQFTALQSIAGGESGHLGRSTCHAIPCCRRGHLLSRKGARNLQKALAPSAKRRRMTCLFRISVYGLGCRIQGLGVKNQGSGAGFRVQGSGFRVQGREKDLGSGCSKDWI